MVDHSRPPATTMAATTSHAPPRVTAPKPTPKKLGEWGCGGVNALESLARAMADPPPG